MPLSNFSQPLLPQIVNQVFCAVGAIIVMLLLVYIVGRVIYAFTNNDNEKQPADELRFYKMPLLRPIRIPTKGHGLIKRILVWIYQVREWELVEDWEYQLSREDRIVLRKGFVFDGASIPRVLWAFLNPVGLLLIPGLIHDYGYRHRQLWKIGENGKNIVPHMQGRNKAHWDRLFLKVGKQVNGMKIINLIAFLAVYIFGYIAWYGNGKKEQKENLSSRPVIDQRQYEDQYLMPNLDFMGSRKIDAWQLSLNWSP